MNFRKNYVCVNTENIVSCSVNDPCQNVVIFSHDTRLVLTGGADGCIRVWNFPELKEKLKIEASKKEVADLDISSDRKLVSEKQLTSFETCA